MANFTTHIGVGTVVSGMLATLTLAADVIAPDNLVAVTMAGVLGSVLPDIDLKDSRPSRALFSGLAVFLSFAVLFTFAHQLSIAEMWVLWLGTFAFVRFPLKAAFHRFSSHRGIWHSILAGAFFLFITVLVFRNVLDRPEGVAWLAGGFLFIGFMTHLVLDEIYSVDVLDQRIKASFGSALKLIDGKHLGDTAAVALATAVAFAMTPPPSAFLEGIASRPMWFGLQQRLLPHDNKWFGVLGSVEARMAQRPAAAITTGSIGPAASAAPSPQRAAEPPAPGPGPQ